MNAATTVATLPSHETARLRRLAADVIRGLAMDGVQKANSATPECPWGADAAVVLREFGVTATAMAEAARAVLSKMSSQ